MYTDKKNRTPMHLSTGAGSVLFKNLIFESLI